MPLRKSACYLPTSRIHWQKIWRFISESPEVNTSGKFQSTGHRLLVYTYLWAPNSLRSLSFICVRVHAHLLHVCVHTDICARTYVCAYIHIQPACARMHIPSCVCAFVCVCTRAPVCLCTRVSLTVYRSTHLHSHMCKHTGRSRGHPHYLPTTRLIPGSPPGRFPFHYAVLSDLLVSMKY